jgi:hypothetical protein
MEYWYYVDHDEHGNSKVVVISEEEIIEQYWPYWYKQACDKFGKDYVDQTFEKDDCIDDWITINWAWQENK